MQKNDLIYVCGHTGLVGSAIVRILRNQGYSHIITRTSGEMDLRNQMAVHQFFKEHRPKYVFLAAAKVGGIHANNTYPAEFYYDNITIQTNVIQASYEFGVNKLLFLGSSCIYPKMAPQPIHESYFMTGPLEETNDAYAIAKISGIKMCQAYYKQYGSTFISVMPTNLYGPGDHYHLQNSHVLPALIRKFHEAKINEETSVTVWGTGTPRREFMFVDDAASACIFLMNNYNEPEIINIGTGEDHSIAQVAKMIKEAVGYTGEIIYDHSKPDGTPRKLLNVEKIKSLGWFPEVDLQTGIHKTYSEFSEKYSTYTKL
jgi:GDP-L-fucose synthase